MPNLFEQVTEQIIAAIEAGASTYQMPWHSTGEGRPVNVSGQAYRGINVLLLWAEAMTRSFAAPIWITFRQALALGGHVRKGEHGSTVVYANKITRTDSGNEGQEVERQIPFLKAYTVFNVDQVEGLPAHFYAVVEPKLDAAQRIDHADAFFAATDADIRHGGGQAYYALQPDYVQMPPFECFEDPEAYYATLAHECTHWTRHPTRLDRDFGRTRWGDEGYAREELVAELGAAFLCADLGLELEPRPDHASYIDRWLKVLKDDRRFIFTAAAHAQRAADFLHQRQAVTIAA
jgi:antirestriction protein ArdC